MNHHNAIGEKGSNHIKMALPKSEITMPADKRSGQDGNQHLKEILSLIMGQIYRF